MIKQMAKDFFIKWQQACYVCFPLMVQGNLSALTFTHWIKANQTGLIAGAGAVLIGYTVLKRYKDALWFHGVSIGVATFVGDLLAVSYTHLTLPTKRIVCTPIMRSSPELPMGRDSMSSGSTDKSSISLFRTHCCKRRPLALAELVFKMLRSS